MPVELKLTFNSFEEIVAFVSRHAASQPIGIATQAVPIQQPSPPLVSTPTTGQAPPTPTSVIPPSGSAASVIPSSPAPGPATQALDLARHEMAQLLGKFESGKGALKVKEILSKYGLSRVGAATPEQLPALTADFQAAQLAA